MNKDLINELIRIVEQLPDENSCLDYKLIPYKNNQSAELVKDLCAFLNSEEGYKKDKYIIIGINDKKEVMGITTSSMQDDRFDQSAADYIFPRPLIESGTFKHKIRENELTFGYIYISKDNTDRVYEINKNCFYKKDKSEYTLEEALSKTAVASTAWIRRGSCKRILDEYTRRKIYESDKLKKDFFINNSGVYYNTDDSISNKIIKAALLFGKWNENNENDKKMLENYTGILYEDFVEKLRLISKKENDYIFKKGTWEIKNRQKYIKYYALDFYKEDFDNFYKIVVEVLKEKHPKLDLSVDKRYLYNIYGKLTKYSSELREGISENLVLVESLKNEFENCKIDASNYVILSIREILKNSDWRVWASLDKCLPLLAESSPIEFLNQFEDYIKKDKEIKIITECENGITLYNYSISIYSSLELIAWDKDTFVRSCMDLATLAKKDKNAINHIVSIILPWYPNTFAPFTFRKTLVENILKFDIDIGWQIIKKLMPGITTYSVPTYKPKYINVPEEEISITNKEYYEQIDEYVMLMIKYSRTSDDRLIDLIDLLNKVSKNNFDKICNYLKASKIKNKNDKSKYKLWNKLKKLVTWLNKQKKIKEEIKAEMINKIECVVNVLKPNDDTYIISRLFVNNSWDLLEDYDNYDESERKLHELQIKEIKNLCNKKGISHILYLANIVEDSYKLGFVFANIKLTDEEEKNLILYNLDKSNKLIDFSKGYIYKKYNIDKNEYNIKSLYELSIKSKINFLQMLPFTIQTFKRVEELLKNKYKNYWKFVDIRTITDNDTLEYIIKKLMEVERYTRVLWIYRLSLNNKVKKIDNNIILTCLEKIKDNFNQYDICEIIVDLQKNGADKNRLFCIEWKYLPLLNDGDYRPITMESELASNVKKYVEILELAYKEHSKEKDDRNIDSNISINAYRLLHQWKVVPGTEKNEFINKNKLNSWYEEMIELCKKKDRLEVGLLCFGNVLFYSPKDKKGFWIDKSVANILNGNDIIRNGFRNKAVNSVGVVYCDENGTEYLKKRDEYYQKAEQTELEGYHKFATALREIAQDFEFHANHIKDKFYDR